MLLTIAGWIMSLAPIAIIMGLLVYAYRRFIPSKEEYRAKMRRGGMK